MIKESTISSINDLDIVQVISQFVTLDKSNKACCPFHNEKSPSFSVNPKGFFKCFGCGEGGAGPISFLMKLEDLSFTEAIERLAQQYNITIEYDEKNGQHSKTDREGRKTSEQLLKFAYNVFRKHEHARTILSWLGNRNLSPITSRFFELGFAPNTEKYLTSHYVQEGLAKPASEIGLIRERNQVFSDVLRNRITIPIHDHLGRLVGFSGRLIEGKFAKYVNPKSSPVYDKSRILYNLHRAIPFIKENKRTCYVTEGYLDVISPYEVGITNVVATCGTALTQEQVKLLKRFADNVVIWYDGDSAGWSATRKAIPLMVNAGLNVAVLNIPGYDPDDYCQTKKRFNTTPRKLKKELTTIQKNSIEWLIDYLLKPRFYYSCNETKLTETQVKKIKSLGELDIEDGIVNLTSPYDLTEFLSDITLIHNEEIPIEGESYGLVKEVLSVINQCNPLAQDDHLKYLHNVTKVKLATLKQMLKGVVVKETKSLEENVTNKDKLPKGVNEEEYKKFGFYEHGGCYHSLTAKGSGAVSNFTLEILYHVKTASEEAYRLMRIRNIHGYETELNLNTDDFVALASFRKKIARRGNFLWYGTEADLTRLQDKLQRSEKTTKHIEVLGYQPRGNFYAFANGIFSLDSESDYTKRFHPVDDYGIVNFDNKHYFIPALSKMYLDQEDLFIGYRKFRLIDGKVTLQEWFRVFDVVYGNNGRIGFMFYVAALFSNSIFKALSRRFPILNLYGHKGSGKGTFGESIKYLFGEPQDSIMLSGSTTPVGFSRSFAQFRNGIVLVDEYKNSINPKIIENLKSIYDRQGYKRGKKDHSFETNTVPVYSAMILAGQHMPTIETALFERLIMLTFSGSSRTAERKKYFGKLKKLQEQGISHITGYLLRYSELFNTHFYETHLACNKELTEALQIPEVSDRFIDNYSSLLTTCKLLLRHEDLGFSYQDFLQLVAAQLKHQYYIMIGSDDVSKFWEIVESLFVQNHIKEGREFELSDKKLYIRIQNIIGLYQQEMRQRNDANALNKASLEDYLKLDKTTFIERKKKQFIDGSYTHCMVFNYPKLDINLISMGNASQETIESRYREMGVDIPNKSFNQTPDEIF